MTNPDQHAPDPKEFDWDEDRRYFDRLSYMPSPCKDCGRMLDLDDDQLCQYCRSFEEL